MIPTTAVILTAAKQLGQRLRKAKNGEKKKAGKARSMRQERIRIDPFTASVQEAWQPSLPEPRGIIRVLCSYFS
jgi:hypothetical protein